MKSSLDIRKDFPIFNKEEIAYLDSGATSQKPKCVIDAVDDYYNTNNANAHRGAYNLSVKSTQIYEESRNKVAQFIGAQYPEETIFTKNATESLNLIAYSYGLENVNSGDEIVLSIMEHHSMIVPWQMVAKCKNAVLKYMYLNDDYKIDEKEIESKITNKTKVVGILSVSNVLGTINDYKKIIDKAHSVGAVVIVDISQSIAHMPFNVKETDADFVVFSGHKMYAPFGVGVLYGKKELLEKMPPFLCGGDMIEYVYEDYTTFAPIPNKFEAGTQDVGAVCGLKTAIEYIESIGYDNIHSIEKDVVEYAYDRLSSLPYITLYCTKDRTCHSGVISFNIKGVHPHDVASILDINKVCVRSGNHCAQPLLRYIGVDSTCRASFAMYNTHKDVDMLINALEKVYNAFKKYIKDN